MYDAPGSDTGREWIEVRNDVATSVALATLKLADAKGGHKIIPVSGENVVAPGQYALIVRDAAAFAAAHGPAAMPLFKSAFSLGNESGTIELRNASGTLDAFTYRTVMGAAGDGNTLSRAGAGATPIARSPSPGLPMSASAIVPVPKQAKAVAPAKKPARAKTAAAGRQEPEASATQKGSEDESEAGPVASSTRIASVAASQTSYEWPLAAGATATVAAIGILASRRAKKREWTIIDETPEDA